MFSFNQKFLQAATDKKKNDGFIDFFKKRLKGKEGKEGKGEVVEDQMEESK